MPILPMSCSGVPIWLVLLARGQMRFVGEQERIVGNAAGVAPRCTGRASRRFAPASSIEAFLGKLPPDVVVVIDEAYHHFAGRSLLYSSFLDQPVADNRVVVLRTFSKAFGLAGLRIGYAIASPELSARLQSRVTDSGVSELGLQAALAALDDDEGLQLAVKRNADDRQEFFNQAMARMLKPIDSKTNFVMMDTHHSAAEAIEHFRKNNVLIGRAFPPLNGHIRISLGTRQEMDEFWKVWDMLPYSHGMKM